MLDSLERAVGECGVAIAGADGLEGGAVFGQEPLVAFEESLSEFVAAGGVVRVPLGVGFG